MCDVKTIIFVQIFWRKVELMVHYVRSTFVFVGKKHSSVTEMNKLVAQLSSIFRLQETNIYFQLKSNLLYRTQLEFKPCMRDQ